MPTTALPRRAHPVSLYDASTAGAMPCHALPSLAITGHANRIMSRPRCPDTTSLSDRPSRDRLTGPCHDAPCRVLRTTTALPRHIKPSLARTHAAHDRVALPGAPGQALPGPPRIDRLIFLHHVQQVSTSRDRLACLIRPNRSHKPGPTSMPSADQLGLVTPRPRCHDGTRLDAERLPRPPRLDRPRHA